MPEEITSTWISFFHFKKFVDIFSFFEDTLIFSRTWISHFGSNFNGTVCKSTGSWQLWYRSYVNYGLTCVLLLLVNCEFLESRATTKESYNVWLNLSSASKEF